MLQKTDYIIIKKNIKNIIRYQKKLYNSIEIGYKQAKKIKKIAENILEIVKF